MISKLRFAIFCFILLTPLLTIAQNNKSSNRAAKDSITNANKPEPIELVEINYQMEQTQRFLSKLKNSLKNNDFNFNIDSVITLKNSFLHKEADDLNNYNKHNLSKFIIENALHTWHRNQKELLSWKDIANENLVAVQKDIEKLKGEKEVWKLSIDKLKNKKDIPYQIVKRATSIIRKIDAVTKDFIILKKKLIIWENNIMDMVIFSNEIVEKITALQDHLRDNLFISNEIPLWKVKVPKSDILPINVRIQKTWHENLKNILNFTAQQSFVVLFVIMILLLIGFFLLRNIYNKLNYDAENPGFVNTDKIINTHKYATTVLILLSLSLLFLPTIPLSLSAIITLFLLWSIYIILPEFTGNNGKIVIVVISAMFFINELEVLFWNFGSLARYYLTFEALLGIWLTFYYGTNKFVKPKKSDSPFIRNVYLISIILFIIFVLAFISNIFGYVILSGLLLKLATKSAISILIITAIQKILIIITKASCESCRVLMKEQLINYWNVVEKRVIQLINIYAYYVIVKLILISMDMYRPVVDWLTTVFVYQAHIGAITISLGEITGMILILIFTFLFANIFNIIFENSNALTNKLSKGVVFAISTTVRYIIIIFGVVLGLSYAGIDLGKFGLLAGALGVGIGFGLQNIVNNFISGLILLYERPIQVGDTIEVGDLMGEVKSIGVRASRVRTFEGAEVVVPNGNIISNDLINWTLSDAKRRIEINIGIVYGSDPNEVLKLLQEVGFQHNKVLVEPPPRALFDGFGESSLNFRLLCWTQFDVGLSVKSELAISVYNALTEAGIEIPFPQMDLHIKEHLTQSPHVVKPKVPGNSPEGSEKM